MLQTLCTGDVFLFTRINQEWTGSWLDFPMKLLSSVPLLLLILAAGGAFFVWRRLKKPPGPFGRKRGMKEVVIPCLMLVCSVAVTDGLSNLIKHHAGRQRPCHVLTGARYPDGSAWRRRQPDDPTRAKPGSSFPSAHASNSMALAVSLVRICPRLGLVVYGLPAGVGYSRVYLGSHYPSDVLGGWLLGWLVSSIVCRAFRAWPFRPAGESGAYAESRRAEAQQKHTRRAQMEPSVSTVALIIPVYNEEENIPILFAEILGAMEMQKRPWQALFVDDGSSDKSLSILRDLAGADRRVRYLSFARNCGQSAAFAAGFRHAEGSVFVTLDADLQNDPMDIPGMLDRYDEGHDMVVGWRTDRKDTRAKRWASKFANRVRNFISRETIHDTGCSLKVLNAAMARELPMFTGMHRFLPTLMKMQGAKVAEVMVKHRARKYGASKYGIWDRAFSALYDLLAVRWMQKRHCVYKIAENR